MDPVFRLEKQAWYNKEPGDDEPLPCVCCQGTGVHEKYGPDADKWIQQDCIPCHGTGKMTPSEIKAWYRQCEGMPY